MPPSARAEGLGFSNRPMRNFVRRIRRTASSSRAIGISPAFTCASVVSYRPFQLSGAIAMSRPALKVCAQSVLLQPLIWPWPFQSPTTKPPNCMRSFSTSVSRSLRPCIFSPWKLLYEAITDCAPAAIAAT